MEPGGLNPKAKQAGHTALRVRVRDRVRVTSQGRTRHTPGFGSEAEPCRLYLFRW